MGSKDKKKVSALLRTPPSLDLLLRPSRFDQRAAGASTQGISAS